MAVSGYYFKVSGLLFTPSNYYNLTYKKKLNQLYDFSVTLFNLSTTQASHIAENNTFELYDEANRLILKGKITKKNYNEETEEYEIGGNDDAIDLYNTVYPYRQQFTNTDPSYIVKLLISGVMSEGNIEASGTLDPISFRIEHDSRLRAIASLAKITDCDWWVDHDDSGNARLNFMRQRGSTSSQAIETFTIRDNVFEVERVKKSYEVWNVIKTMGYGDGINQKQSECYHATKTQRTYLASTLLSGATECAVLDVSNFNNSGVLRIGIEEIAYSSRNTVTNYFAGLSRGVNNTTIYEHNKGIEVYDINQYTKDNPEPGSSIQKYGIKENVYVDRSIRDQNTLDLLAQRLLAKYKDTVERIQVKVMKSYLTSSDIGDYVVVDYKQ